MSGRLTAAPTPKWPPRPPANGAITASISAGPTKSRSCTSPAPSTSKPRKNAAALYELLALANEKLWIGHFGLDKDDGMPIFRHAVLLRGAPSASAESIEDMVDIAITECERFFPAFQFVLWGGKSPDAALDAAMLECIGEA